MIKNDNLPIKNEKKLIGKIAIWIFRDKDRCIVHVKRINSQKISLVIQIILNVIQQLLYSCIWLVEHKSLVRTKEENKINYIRKENMVYSEDIYLVYHTFKVLRFQGKEKNVPKFLLLYFPIKTCLFIFHMVLKGFSVLLYIYILLVCLFVCIQ